MAAGRYEEPNQLLRGGADGVFADVSSRAGSALSFREVSRGAAFGDYDNDGDIDVVMVNNNGPVRLFRNESPDNGNWLSVRLAGRELDRDGIGSEVVIEIGDRRRRRQVQPCYSYCSSNDPRVHFGLGEIETVDAVTVIWPDGRRETRADVAANQFVVFDEPRSDAAPGEP